MKVAAFLNGWNKEYLYYIYSGFRKYAKENFSQIDVYICFGKEQDFISEYGLYDMPKMERYDGFIIALNTIMNQKIQEKLIAKIRKSKKPCVSIEIPVEGFSWIGINQYQAVQDMVKHMEQVHSIEYFAFLGGISGTYEADIRKKAFLDIIREHGLQLHPEWIFTGGYQYQDGYNVGVELLRKESQHQKIPECFICANDAMAAGLYDSLRESVLCGRVKISGFDRYFDGEDFTPMLTTVARPKEEVAYQSCVLLEKLILSGEIFLKKELEYIMIYGNTCGCTRRWDKSHLEYREIEFRRRQKLKKLEGRIQYLEEHTTQEISLSGMLKRCKDVLEEIGCSYFKVVLNQNLLSDEVCKYRDCNKVELEWNNEKDVASGGVFVFVPLYFQQRIMGYSCLRDISRLLRYECLERYMKIICFALENYIQKQQYKEINEKYHRLYMTDQLTGLYNRFGLQEYGQKLYQENCRNQKNTKIIFCDINRLKYINDNFGHKAGDWAICLVGNVLLECRSELCLPFRYGGDEFILVAEEHAGEKIVSKIKDRLQEKQKEQKEFYVSVSSGEMIAPYDGIDIMPRYCQQQGFAARIGIF